MKKFFPLLLLYLGLCQWAYAQDTLYTFKPGDRFGSGKWYMGREIAHVMGYQAMSWLDRPEREAEEETRKLIKNMDIQPKDVIADIGAGSGYHVFRIVKKAKQGTIYAVDIQAEMLAAIQAKRSKRQTKLIQTVLGTEQSINLAPNSLDKVLMVDVYHEFSYPAEMLASILQALKPGGLVYLVEYRTEDPLVPIKQVHKMSEAQAVKEFKANGFRLKENINNLPWQHFIDQYQTGFRIPLV